MKIQKSKTLQVLSSVFIIFCIIILSGISSQQGIIGPSASVDGKQVWERTYSLDDYHLTGTGMFCDEEFIYTCGYKIGPYSGSVDIELIVVKWNSRGKVIWEYTLDSVNRTKGWDIWGDDSYLYVCGESAETMYAQYLIVKLDKDGTEIWQKEWGVPRLNSRLTEIVGDDSGIYLFGAYPDVTLMKFDQNGEVLWNNSWIDSEAEDYFGLLTDNSNIYLWEELSDHYNLIKWNSDGDLSWNQTVLTDEEVSSILGVDIDGTDIYACGYKEVGDAGFAFLGKIDTNGNLVWNMSSIEVNTLTTGNGVTHNSKEIILCGYTASSLSGPLDFYINRYDKNGVLNSIKTSSITDNNPISHEDYWANDEFLYRGGGDDPLRPYVTLEKWDVKINYFQRWGIPSITVVVLIIASWIIIKPIKKLKKRREMNE